MLAHLYIKPCLLEVINQWETASDGVWLALSHHFLRRLVELLEPIRVQVADYTLVCVCVCVESDGHTEHYKSYINY